MTKLVNLLEQMMIYSIKQDVYAIVYIKNPSEEVIKYCLYECEISNTIVLESLYKKLTSDEDKIYFKMKYGGIIND